MKGLNVIIAALILIFLLPACNNLDDGYSLNDSWIGFGLVKKDAVSYKTTVELDNGALLIPVTDYSKLNELKANDRVLTNFTILGENKNSSVQEQYNVQINSIRKILFKGIFNLSPEKEDSIGNDPIYIKDRWLTKNMLNFELAYKGGEKIHYINLVRTPESMLNNTEPIVLELRHNTNDDPEQLLLTAIVTFDLSSLKIAGKSSTKFKVIAKGFDEKISEFEGEYKY